MANTHALPSQIGLPEFDQLPALTAAELDAIACDTQATLEALLTQDVLAASTVASYASALRYWDAWHRASTGIQLPLLRDPRQPVGADVVCAFVAHHSPHEVDGRTCMAMPEVVAARIKQLGGTGKRLASRRDSRVDADLPTLATIKHRTAALSACHRLAGIEPPFAGADSVKQALRALSNRASRMAPAMLRQPKKIVSRDMLTAMLRECLHDGLRGLRDAALLHVAFHTGGRRRSEIADMRWPDLVSLALPEPVEGVVDGYLWTLNKVKGKRRERADVGVMEIPILGAAAEAVDRWRDAVFAYDLPRSGPVWYRLVNAPEGGSGGLVPSTPIIGVDVWHIIRLRTQAIGLNPDDFGAHSLRSGAVTTFLREGGALADATAMLGHAKLETTRTYYDHRGVPTHAPARLISKHTK